MTAAADSPRSHSAVHSIPAALDHTAIRFADRPALLGCHGTFSFATLAHASRHLALALARLGANKGTHVGLLFPNHPEWWVAAWAVWRLGAVLVPLNTLWTPSELGRALESADVHLLLAIQRFRKHDYVAALEQCGVEPQRQQARLPRLPCLHTIVWYDAEGIPEGLHRERKHDRADEDALAWLAAQQATVTPADDAAIFFTSGSEAAPKAVVHSHASILAAASGIAERLGLTDRDRVWAHLPWFFAGGAIAGVLAAWLRGAGSIYQDLFDPGEAIALMAEFGATTFFGWPHQAHGIVDHPAFSTAGLHLRKGPGAQADWADRLYGTEHHAVSSWGMTETGPMAATSAWTDALEKRKTTHGRPLPGVDLRIVDPASGSPVDAGVEGEIVVRGATVMSRYYGRRPVDCFDAQGFFHTGDRGWLDADGYLHFVGRTREVLKTAGASVSPAEIERVLYAHPAVHSAAVVGLPHPARGEIPVAFVVCHHGAKASPEELSQYCRSQLAAYKVPQYIFVLPADDWPQLGSGKVDKAALRARAEAMLRPAAPSP